MNLPLLTFRRDTLGCLQEVRSYDDTNGMSLVRIYSVWIYRIQGETEGDFRGGDQGYVSQLSTWHWKLSFSAGADVLVVAPTGMGKVSPCDPYISTAALNHIRASAFKSPRLRKRFVFITPFFNHVLNRN
jgi:hypothetical protein